MDFNLETLSWLEEQIEEFDLFPNIVRPDDYTRADLQAWCEYLEEREEEGPGDESVFLR